MNSPLSFAAHRSPPGQGVPVDRALVGFLSRLPMLEGVPRTVIEDLACSAQARRVSRGTVLWSPGDAADTVCFVRSGVVVTTRSMGDHDVTLDYLGRGELIGLGGGVRGGEARMHEDGTLLSMSRAAFDAWLGRHPDLAPVFLDCASAEGRRLAERLALVSMHGAKSRLALLLLDLAARFGVRDSRGVIVDVRLTHRELAALIGATRETVSVAIVDLRSAALIATESRRVVLLDPPGLEAVAGA